MALSSDGYLDKVKKGKRRKEKSDQEFEKNFSSSFYIAKRGSPLDERETHQIHGRV